MLPGGHVEAGETTAAAALRELTEETTLEGRIDRLLWARTDEDGRQSWYYLIRDWSCEPRLAGEEAQRNSAENSYELGWASKADLVAWNLRPVGIRGPVAELLCLPDSLIERAPGTSSGGDPWC